jgi:hypothetical protein
MNKTMLVSSLAVALAAGAAVYAQTSPQVPYPARAFTPAHSGRSNFFDVAMFLAQQVNDHGPLLDPKADRYPRAASVAAFAQYSL